MTDNSKCFNLTGFMFGNIDELGQLEGDMFDSESQKHLASLGKLGLNPFIKEMLGDEELKDDLECQDDGYYSYILEELDDPSMKSPSAVDFFDIDELADDEEIFTQSFNEDYDAAHEMVSEDDTPILFPLVPVNKDQIGTVSETSGYIEDKKLDSITIPSTYADVDCTNVFPNFQDGKKTYSKDHKRPPCDVQRNFKLVERKTIF